MSRNDLPMAFHEAGHVAAAWSRGLEIPGAMIVPTPEFQGLEPLADPLRGIRFDGDTTARAREQAEIRDHRSSRGAGSAAHPQPALLALSSWGRRFQTGRRPGFAVQWLRRGDARLSRLAGAGDPRRDRSPVAASREGRPRARRPADFDRGGGQDPAGVAIAFLLGKCRPILSGRCRQLTSPPTSLPR